MQYSFKTASCYPLLLHFLQKIPILKKISKTALPLFVRMQFGKDFRLDAEPLKSAPGSFIKTVNLLKEFENRPLISILIPVYNTDENVLKQCMESVISQIYKNWEICIADDASDLPHVRRMLTDYAQKDPRIRLVFSEQNQGIAGNIHKAACMASGEYIAVLDHDDELEPMTLFEYVRLLNLHPDADVIYCDEDKIDEGGIYCDPWHKSAWNPDLSLSFNYVMHFVMLRRSLYEKIGGVRSDYEGSQDYDLLLRIAEHTDRIYHIPKILYHWRMGSGSIASAPEAKPGVFVSGLAALNDALKRRGIRGRAEDAPDAWKGVYRVIREIPRPLSCSILIHSKGDEKKLERILESPASAVPGKNTEILISFHSSLFCDMEKICTESGRKNIRLIEYSGKDCISRSLNAAAWEAKGEVLFFLDESMEISDPESYDSLMEQIQREEVGAVGGKVYYAEGLVEHAGIIFGPFGIMGYSHRATPDDPGYVGIKNMICNYSAVMGLGMMSRKEVFRQAGGFDENFCQAYWDADYCLRLREKGFLITYTPYAKMKHHIPIPLPGEMIREPEASIFRERWQHIIDNDPCFNPNFSRDVECFYTNQSSEPHGVVP